MENSLIARRKKAIDGILEGLGTRATVPLILARLIVPEKKLVACFDTESTEEVDAYVRELLAKHGANVFHQTRINNHNRKERPRFEYTYFFDWTK